MIEKALKLTRQFHRMSQTALAEKLGISKSYLSEIESGSKAVTLDLLDRYAAAFRVPASTFLIFAETREHGEDPARTARVKKLLRALEWIAEGSEDDEDGPDTIRAT